MFNSVFLWRLSFKNICLDEWTEGSLRSFLKHQLNLWPVCSWLSCIMQLIARFGFSGDLDHQKLQIKKHFLLISWRVLGDLVDNFRSFIIKELVLQSLFDFWFINISVDSFHLMSGSRAVWSLHHRVSLFLFVYSVLNVVFCSFYSLFLFKMWVPRGEDEHLVNKMLEVIDSKNSAEENIEKQSHSQDL